MFVRRRLSGLILCCIGMGILLALLLPPIGWVFFIGVALILCGLFVFRNNC